jgi:hypothetical protein
MNYNQFSKLSCYEEFEIQCALMGISKIDILNKNGYQIDNYYYFISEDGIFNWYDLNGNHIEDPGILKELKDEHIPVYISKCIIPNSVTCINYDAFAFCASLNEITIPDSVTNIGDDVFYDCSALKKITIPDNVTSIGNDAFLCCESLKEVIFKGKTLEQIKQMEYYPFGIEDENIIKCEM